MLLARTTPLALCLCGLLALPAAAQEGQADGEPPPPPAVAEPAESGKAGTGSVELRISYYDNEDGSDDGNPFIDEAETVIEPVFVVDYNVTDRLALSLTGSYDFVSSASIDRLSEFPEQSGASGDYYFGGDLGFRYQATDSVKFGGHAGASAEYDYTSFGVGGDVALDLFEKNTTLSLSVNAFFDTVDVIRFQGSESEGDEDRLSVTANLGWYQILTPTVHMSLGLSFTHQSGFLETAFNQVVLEDPARPLTNVDPDVFLRDVQLASRTAPVHPSGQQVVTLPNGATVVQEELPDNRIRFAVFGEVRKIFPSTGTAVGLWGRVYTDTWGIFSGTVELKFFQWIVKDVLRIRVRYRFYTQTAADDYEERFRIPVGQRDQFIVSQDRTQDGDLGDFISHTIGLKFTIHLSESVKVDVGGDYVLRDDGIDQILGSLGLRWDF